MALDPQTFREAMSRFCVAACIVTTEGPAGRCGLTVTAVCPVTDTPPIVMICVNRNSATNAVFKKNGVLCVNILSETQEHLARHFAGQTDLPMEKRFGFADWDAGGGGPRLLAKALDSLRGHIVEVFEIGTHSVLVAQIDDIALAEGSGCLVYFGRQFASVPVRK